MDTNDQLDAPYPVHGIDVPEPTPESLKVARRVYVGNLAWKTSWQDLKDFFSQVGTVKYADVLREGGPGTRSKGCGIVEFESPDQALLAIKQLNHTELDGRSIFIREDREDYELRKFDSPPTSHGNPGPQSSIMKRKKHIPAGPVSIGRRVYVGNVAPEISWKELKDHFKTAGHVLHTDILTDSEGKSKGCGIVEFSAPAEALRAISHLSNSVLGGRQILVREDREDPLASTGRGHKMAPQMMSMGPEGTRVVLHGIPYRMAWQDLKDLCRQAGHVVRADVMSNADGTSKGYAVVQFATFPDAVNAIRALNGQIIEGRIITAKFDRFGGHQ